MSTTTFNLNDIVSNQGPAAVATTPAPAGTSFKLDDIATNQGPATSATSAPPDQPGMLSRAWTGAKQFAKPIMDIVSGEPATPTEALVHASGGTPGLAAYRIAKGVVDSAENVAKSGPGKYKQAKDDFSRTVQDFHNKDYRDMVIDALNSAQDVTPAVVPGGGGLATREENEGLRKGGNFVTPFVRDALTAGTVALGVKNPFSEAAAAERAAAAAATPEEAAAATSKIEPAVAARTAKAGLAPGDAGLTTDAASAQTAQSALDAQAATQKNIDTTLQDIAGQHAKANGITAPAPGTATRDILTTNGDALVEAGKANYKILDKFTDGKFTNAQNELKNAQLELRSKAGTTDADTSTLEANVTRAQWNVDQLFDNAVKNGMPQTTADAARTQFRTGQATLDAGNAVRMANKARGAAGVRTTDLNALENRWTALSDSGRLQQAFGEQGAKDALTQIHAAREAGEVFESLPPTESQALNELISKNTVTDKFGTRTAWRKVRSDFSSLPDRGARFSDVPKVEKFLNNQVFYQTLRQGTLGVAGTALGGAAFRLGESAVPLP